MLLVILILCLFAAVLLTIFAISGLTAFLLTRVPFVRTNSSDIEFIIRKLELSPEDTVYELGSGDGHVAFLFERLAGCKVVGYELGWFIVWWARLQAKVVGSKARFINKNFFKADWSDAGIIYCYLFPPLMARIEQKFKKEMRPGSLAIVRDFPFPTMEHWEKYAMPKAKSAGE